MPTVVGTSGIATTAAVVARVPRLLSVTTPTPATSTTTRPTAVAPPKTAHGTGVWRPLAVIAPANNRSSRLADGLRSETSLRISHLDVRELFDVYKGGELITDWPCLMALGAALRTDATAL